MKNRTPMKCKASKESSKRHTNAATATSDQLKLGHIKLNTNACQSQRKPNWIKSGVEFVSLNEKC